MTPGRLLLRLGRLFGDRRGAVSPFLALMLVPLVGMLGMATEASSWFFTQRSMQNAADSAAVAAAINAGATYNDEAQSVAGKFGFADGVNNTTVVASNKALCLDGKAACYSVTITRKVPIYLTRIVGFAGDATVDGGRAQTVQAAAVASPKASANLYCLLSLADNNKTVLGISTAGAPKADLSGCNVATNGQAICSGHNLKAPQVDAGGASGGNNKECGTTTNNFNQDLIADPYSARAANIPAATACGSYPQTTTSNKLPASLTIGATAVQYCGNVNLTTNTTITTPPGGGVMVIKNGALNVPKNLTLSAGANGLTIIFTNPTGIAASHILNVDGTINIAGPSSGLWKGVAIYQDPAMTNGVSYSANGSGTTWNISGLIYMPHADISFAGAIDKASSGVDCFALVDRTFSANGTAQFLEHQSGCSGYLDPPSGGVSGRQALVK